MDPDLHLRLAVYRYFVENARAPTVDDMCRFMDMTAADVTQGLQRLHAARMLVLAPDGVSIRMALPFSGVPTQHRVRANGREYFANCAWDSFGIPAALHTDAEVISRCEQSGDELRVRLGRNTQLPTSWRFHAAVPAAHWWRDIVHT